MASSSPTFGPQWPQHNPYIVTLARKDGLRIPLHKEIVPLASMLMDQTEVLGYNILPGQTWGYGYRPISGTNLPSNHSRGVAIDINAPSNPYASVEWHRRNARGTKPFGLQLVCNIPQKVIVLWERYGFYWGGRYSTKPDPMHFEFLETVAECKVLTKRLYNELHPPPEPTPPQESDMSLLIAEQGTGRWMNTDGIVKKHETDREHVRVLVYLGMLKWEGPNDPFDGSKEPWKGILAEAVEVS